MDYIFRYLSLKFMRVHKEEETDSDHSGEEQSTSGYATRPQAQMQTQLSAPPEPVDSLVGSTVEAFMEAMEGSRAGKSNVATFRNQEDSPACPNCGSITVRSGACYSCLNCGSTSGCG